MFVGGDPLGPLTTALTRQDGGTYAAYEIVLRVLPPKEDWRAPLREQIGQIQGTINPEDLAAYEALVRKVEAHGFDVVVRCIVATQTRDDALRQLRAMHHALRTLAEAEESGIQIWIDRTFALGEHLAEPLTADTRQEVLRHLQQARRRTGR